MVLPPLPPNLLVMTMWGSLVLVCSGENDFFFGG